MTAGRLLPKLEGDNGPEFAGGDVRARENPGLATLHTLFVREHNRIAVAFRDMVPQWSDEEVYQRTRRQDTSLFIKIINYSWLLL